MPVRYALGPVEVELLWAELALPGAPPLVLRIGSPGRTHAERREIVAAGRRALRERGLLDDAGLAGLLRELADAEDQLELRADWADPVRAIAARHAGRAVLAVRRGGAVLVGRCPAAADGLLSTLPAGRAGPGPVVGVPAAALAAAVGAAEPVAALREHGVPGPDARLLGRILGGIVRQAQVVALRRGPDGPRRVGGVLRILEGTRGRYLMTGGCPPGGTGWVTVAPVDRRRLRHRVAELLAAAAADRPR